MSKASLHNGVSVEFKCTQTGYLNTVGRADAPLAWGKNEAEFIQNEPDQAVGEVSFPIQEAGLMAHAASFLIQESNFTAHAASLTVHTASVAIREVDLTAHQSSLTAYAASVAKSEAGCVGREASLKSCSLSGKACNLAIARSSNSVIATPLKTSLR
jgi:hypothetical protein